MPHPNATQETGPVTSFAPTHAATCLWLSCVYQPSAPWLFARITCAGSQLRRLHLPKPCCPWGNAMGRSPLCRHMKGLPGGRGRLHHLLPGPLKRSFPPASCAMSFSSKDSCRRRLRLSQNSKCHGFRYALTVRRPCPFASREPPPLARRTVLGCSQVALVAWSSRLQCHLGAELRAGLPANSSWSLNLIHGSWLACPCPQSAACLRGSSQSPIVSVTKELSPS